MQSQRNHRKALTQLPKLNRQLLIHATNISGLGAIQVVKSLLAALLRLKSTKNATIFVPFRNTFDLIDGNAVDRLVVSYRRIMPNAWSRLCELAFCHRMFTGFQNALVLGDVPLRGINNQTVLVHQAHLVSSSINPYSSKSWKFKFMRRVFSNNIEFAQNVIVQTGAMKQQLISSYPILENRIGVIPQPVPDWFTLNADEHSSKSGCGLSLFYPAAGYAHKNHSLIQHMGEDDNAPCYLISELVITLMASELSKLPKLPAWVNNIGRLNQGNCIDTYRQADALFFPSLLESYGLPLVEAMSVGLPIVCADLPYARWLCEDQAIYFDPISPKSAWEAIAELSRRIASGWLVDWRKPLLKLPKSWDVVAEQFVKTMNLRF